MTGEITIRGKVLPIGGLKEKSMAAYKAGIKNVIIPKENERDLEEIDEEIRTALTFYPVDNVDEVIRLATLPAKKVAKDIEAVITPKKKAANRVEVAQ